MHAAKIDIIHTSHYVPLPTNEYSQIASNYLVEYTHSVTKGFWC